KPALSGGGSPRPSRPGAGVPGRDDRAGSVQPTFFAACRVASAAVSAALQTLVDAAFTWLRATFVCSMARCVYGERRMLATSFSPRLARSWYDLIQSLRWPCANSTALP